MWLVTAISFISLLGWFIRAYAPDSIWKLIIFFLIISGSVFCASLFLLKIVRRAMLVTGGVLVILLLRMFGLRDWYYPVLLIPVLISLEILMVKR